MKKLTLTPIEHQEIIKITTEFIKLDSFLKFANVVESGGRAKEAIQEGEVYVNGELCTQRGKKLRPGDKVMLDNIILLVGNETIL